MANPIQFDPRGQGSDSKAKQRPPHCVACEELLADALDGTLGEVDQAWFDRHVDTCATCAETFADAQRGAAWLGMLKSSRPEPRPELLNMILAHVESHAATPAAGEPQAPAPVPYLVASPTPAAALAPLPANVIPMRPRGPAMMRFGRFEFESRLAMTAAMAFFSVALTLNLAGVRLNEIKAASLTPSGLRHTYYETNARVVRYYDNLRVVQVMEARVDTLRTSQDDAPLPAAGDSPAKPDTSSDKPAPRDPGPGSLNQPPALRQPPTPADPVSDSRKGQPNLFVSPAWLRLNAGDLV